MSADPSYGLQQELKPRRPRWGFWSTLAWAVVFAIGTTLAQTALALLFIIWWGEAHPEQPLNLMDLGANGALFGVIVVFSTPLLLALVALAVRLSRVSFRDYLALRWPTLRQFLVGVLLIVVVLPVSDLITVQSGREAVPDFMTDTLSTASNAGPLFLFLFGVALVVMAPLGEEIVFRGFLFRGLGASLGPVAAVILTSLGWAALHLQYEVFFIVQIFVIGLIFGGLRWWSGSLYLVILLHALINAIAFVQAIYATPVLA